MSDRNFCSEELYQQPQHFDAVLGSQTPIANGSVILGGIEGVKSRLNSDRINVIILVLSAIRSLETFKGG